MPGVSKESLEIKVEGDALLIEGTVSSATPQAMEAVYAEVRVPRYRRSFTLSRELNAGGIDAQLKDGVLTASHSKARAGAAPPHFGVRQLDWPLVAK